MNYQKRFTCLLGKLKNNRIHWPNYSKIRRDMEAKSTSPRLSDTSFLCMLLKQGLRQPAACFVRLIKSPFQARKFSHLAILIISQLAHSPLVRQPYWYPNFPSLPTPISFPPSTPITDAFFFFSFYKTFFHTLHMTPKNCSH